MSTETISLTDSIYIRRSPTERCVIKDEKPRELLIYFVPGNPGLIQYYHDFLTHLASLLDPDTTHFIYHVVGHSLGGFELQRDTSGISQLQARMTGRKVSQDLAGHGALSLRVQESFVFASLQQTIAVLQRTAMQVIEGPEDEKPLLVMLIGHSVGSYILMQNLVARHKQQVDRDAGADDDGFKIINGVGLFPTIVDLAGSPRGSRVALLAKKKWFAYIMQFIAFFLRILPGFFVRILVKYITGQPWKAADVTTAFLRSRSGVYQALYMARGELLEMTKDKWPSHIWNHKAASCYNTRKVDRPQLYFFWGDNDCWVRNETRDQIIADHANPEGQMYGPDEEGRPYMEVDSSGIPHDFCTQEGHSKRVAGIVAGYVRESTVGLYSSIEP